MGNGLDIADLYERLVKLASEERFSIYASEEDTVRIGCYHQGYEITGWNNKAREVIDELKAKRLIVPDETEGMWTIADPVEIVRWKKG